MLRNCYPDRKKTDVFGAILETHFAATEFPPTVTRLAKVDSLNLLQFSLNLIEFVAGCFNGHHRVLLPLAEADPHADRMRMRIACA
jgi:hypothetical protein